MDQDADECGWAADWLPDGSYGLNQHRFGYGLMNQIKDSGFRFHWIGSQSPTDIAWAQCPCHHLVRLHPRTEGARLWLLMNAPPAGNPMGPTGSNE